MGYLCIIFVALLVLVGLGHGLWVVAAWLFRQTASSRPRPTERPPCPDCGRPLSSLRHPCRWCGFDAASSTERTLTDLAATTRQLRRFLAAGTIDQATFDRWRGHVLAEQRRLRRQEPERVAEVAVVPAAEPSAEIVTLKIVEPAPAPPPLLLRPVPAPPPLLRAAPTIHEPEAPPAPVIAVTPAPKPPRPPRQPLRAMLTAFMESRNILWGELVGGLLIVGCSIALVVSLWPTLGKVPYSPFVIFATITAALFGAGLYTLHHWKLESTSRGLLVIAALLVPLNFLVMAGLHQAGGGTLLEAGLEVACLALFAGLVRQAARVLVPEGGWLLPVGVLGCAVVQLLAVWLLPAHASLARVLLLGLAAVACEAVSAGGVLARVRSTTDLEPGVASRLFLHLGIVAFAVLVTLGLLSYGADRLGAVGPLPAILERLAIVVALAGVPVLWTGLRVHTGLAARAEAAGLRTAGTAVALAGMAILLGGLALAWPAPAPLIAVSGLNFVILTVVAIRGRLPVAHGLALPCLVLAVATAILAVWLNAGRETLPAALYSAECGVTLVALLVVLGVVAEALARLSRPADALYYVVGAAITGALGLVLVSVPERGVEAPIRALVLYGITGAAGFALNARWRRPLASSLNIAVLVGGTLWALFAFAGSLAQLPWWGTALAVEGLALASLATMLGRRGQPQANAWLAEPMARSAEALALLGALLAVWAGLLAGSWSLPHVLTGGSLCAVLLLLAGAEQRRLLAHAAGLMLSGTAVALAGWLSAQVFQASSGNVLACLTLALAVAAAVQAGAALATVPGERTEGDAPVPWHDVLTVAWRDTAMVTGAAALVLCLVAWSSGSPWLMALPFAFLAATAFSLAQREQQPAWTWLGSTLVLLGLVRLRPLQGWSAFWHGPDLAIALLGHATLTLLAGTALRELRRRLHAPPADSQELPAQPAGIYRVFIGPLLHAALISSLLGLAQTLNATWPNRLTPTLCLLWLASLWLWLARLRHSRLLFAGFQGVLCLAAVYGAAIWLTTQPWYGHNVRTLHVYGIALALLSVGWMALRLCKLPDNLAALLHPPWPAVDRVVLGGLVLGQAGLAVLGILPVLADELGIGDVHPTALTGCFGFRAWLLFSVLALALLIGLWERGAAAAVVGLLVLALTAPVLGAGPFGAVHSASLALRWGLAGCFVACSALLLIRHRLVELARSLGCQVREGGQLPALCRGILLVGAVLPVLAVTAAAAISQFAGSRLEPPLAGTFFAAIPWLVSFGLPLLLVSLGLLGHAVRERSLGYAFAAGLVLNFAITTGAVLVAASWIYLFQANAVAAAVIGLLWLWLGETRSRSEGPRASASPLLAVQIIAPVVLAAILLGTAGGWLFLLPGHAWPADLLRIGEAGGWLAWLAALSAAAWYATRVAPRSMPHLLAACVAGLGILAAAVVGRASQHPWFSYHVWLGWWATAGFGLLGLGWRLARHHSTDESTVAFLGIGSSSRAWAMLLGAGVVLLGLRVAWNDPARPYVSVLAAVAASLLYALVELWRPRPARVYVSGLLLNLAGLFAWITWGGSHPDVAGWTQIVCFALAALVWCVLEQWRGTTGGLRGDWPPFVHLAASLALMLLTGLVALAALTSLLGLHAWAGTPLAWVALGATAAALAVLLIDRTAILASAGLYTVGILALALGLHTAEVGPRLFGWWTGLGLACYVLVAAGIAHVWQRRRLAEVTAPSWFIPAQSVVALVAVLLSVWISLGFAGMAWRLAGPLAVVLLLPAGIAAANRGLTQGRRSMQFAVLILGIVASVEVGWAMLEPSAYTLAGLWLRRTIAAMVALAVLTVLYGIVFSRRLPSLEWAAAARRLGPILGLASSIVLLAVLGQEAWLYRADSTVPAVDPLGPMVISIVLLALVTLFCAALSFAVVPDADPFHLTERGRMAYVYSAEALLALMFVHVRLTVPALFRLDLFTGYWPFVVMGLAFLGAGLSELFQRRGLRVLAEPLERTGIGLPLLPVLAFWLVPAPRYATVWFLAGLLYGLLSLMRRSFRFALLAALSANAGIWVLLHHHEVYLWRHPQLWLIPPALILLVAEHLNRERLGHYQSMALRYLALTIVYVSSTADLFIAGLGQSWTMPLVLIVLCVLGILLGMLLRVRAFLFQGSVFLVLTIVLMIWHAGVDQRQAWILWSSGIVLGAAIVTMFGIFEKRRDEVLRLVEQLKQWQ